MRHFPWPRFEELLGKEHLNPQEQKELDDLNEWIDQVAEQRQQEEWNSAFYQEKQK